MRKAGARIWANLLSATRIALLPFLLHCMARDRWAAAAVLLAVTGLTDVLDGYLARRAAGGHAAGAILDVAADVALSIAIALALYAKRIFGLALPLLVALAPCTYLLVCLAKGAAVRTRAGRYAGAVCVACYGAVFLALMLPPAAALIPGLSGPALALYLCLVCAENLGQLAGWLAWKRRPSVSATAPAAPLH